MPDRFDFLEIGDEPPKPQLKPSTPEVESRWRNLHLKAVEIIGEPGVSGGQFSLPTGIAIDPWGTLYVTDSNNHRIQRITPGGDVYCIGKAGTAVGEMWSPQAVAIHPAGEFFFVAEQGMSRIQCFRFTGQSRGVMNGFRNPAGLTFDPEGRLWVADTGNGRVVRVNIQNGQFLGGLDEKAGFRRPLSVACDRMMRLYIVDLMSQNVICYDAQGKRLFGLADHRRLARPTDCAIDLEGRIYVVEQEANRLHVFDPQGNSLQTFERLSTRMGDLRSPTSVAIGPKGEIYLSDTQNHRVVRLAWE
jgi:DNA-binding beta-propeller fold protein YncE